MRSRGSFLVSAFAGLFALAIGCGLDLVGVGSPLGPDAGIPEDGAVVLGDGAAVLDDGATAIVDGSMPDAPPPECTCELAAPDGWKVVAYADDRSNPCPGDLATVNLVKDPTPLSSACSCGMCATTTLPTCTMSEFANQNDNTPSPTCTGMGVSHPTNPDQCQMISGKIGSHARAVNPIPTGGACNAPTVLDPNGVTSKPVRVCTPSNGGKTCACGPPLGFKTCLATKGDAICPPSAQKKFSLGTDARPTCGLCGCTVANAGCSTVVTFYSDGVCTSILVAIDDQSCQTLPTNQPAYSSLKWVSTPSASCTTSPPTAGAVLVDQTTVCCP